MAALAPLSLHGALIKRCSTPIAVRESSGGEQLLCLQELLEPTVKGTGAKSGL
jgi:hypothetical protein